MIIVKVTLTHGNNSARTPVWQIRAWGKNGAVYGKESASDPSLAPKSIARLHQRDIMDTKVFTPTIVDKAIMSILDTKSIIY